MARTSLPPPSEHPRLVLLGVDDATELRCVLRYLQLHDVGCVPFFDADLDVPLTAIATEPVRGAIRRLFRRYRLLPQPDH